MNTVLAVNKWCNPHNNVLEWAARVTVLRKVAPYEWVEIGKTFCRGRRKMPKMHPQPNVMSHVNYHCL